MSTTYSPPPSRLGRRQHDFLISHGYEYLGPRGGGHYAYKHPEHGMYFVSGTGYDAKGWQAFKSEMRKLFPSAFRVGRPDDAPARERTRLQAAPELPPEVAARVREKQRETRRARAIEAEQAVPVEWLPPGSPESVVAGCQCPPYQNRHGVGIEGRDGVFAEVKHCPLHGWKDEPKIAAVPERRCPCGAEIHQQSGPGRPRKYCESCRPSRWKRWDDDKRQREREYLYEWRRINGKKAA